MKLNKKLMAGAIAGVITVGGVAVGAAQKTDTVSRTFRNIQVEVDGQTKVPTNEPFMINGSVYVGLRDVGTLLGSSVNWDNTTSTVELTTGSTGEVDALKAETQSLFTQLQQAKAEIRTLEQKVEQYEAIAAEPEEEEEPEEVKMDLDALESFLEDEYDDELDIRWQFYISGDEDGLTVDIEYDGDKYHDEYDDADVRDIEEFLEDVCDDIQEEIEDEYDIEHIEIKGEIYDTEAREERAEFDMDDKGRFDFENLYIELIDEDEVKDYMAIIDSNFMKFPKVYMSGYDSSSILIREITAEVEDGEIVFNVFTNMDDFLRGAWDALNVNDALELEEYMEELSDELEGEFDVDVRGYVYDVEKDEMASYNGTLKLH